MTGGFSLSADHRDVQSTHVDSTGSNIWGLLGYRDVRGLLRDCVASAPGDTKPGSIAASSLLSRGYWYCTVHSAEEVQG